MPIKRLYANGLAEYLTIGRLIEDVFMAAKMRESGLTELATTHKESAGYLPNHALDQMILHFGLIPGNYRSKPFCLSPDPPKYYSSVPIPKFQLRTPPDLHLKLRGFCLQLRLLRRPFDDLTQIPDRQLQREIHRRERQGEQQPPPGGARHEPKRPGGDQTLARNGGGAVGRLPECRRQQGEDEQEGPFEDGEADVDAEAADGEHEGEEGHGDEEEAEGGGELGRGAQPGRGVQVAVRGRVVPVGADGRGQGRGEGEPETPCGAPSATRFTHTHAVCHDLEIDAKTDRRRRRPKRGTCSPTPIRAPHQSP